MTPNQSSTSDSPVTVFPGLGPGLGLTIDPFDPDYEKKVLIATEQAEIDKENAAAVTKYKQDAANVKEQNQNLFNSGRGPLLTLDPPPHKLGLNTSVFPPMQIQLTDLVCDPISVAPDTSGGQPSAGEGPGMVAHDPFSTVLANQAHMTQMLTAIWNKLNGK